MPALVLEVSGWEFFSARARPIRKQAWVDTNSSGTFSDCEFFSTNFGLRTVRPRAHFRTGHLFKNFGHGMVRAGYRKSDTRSSLLGVYEKLIIFLQSGVPPVSL